MLCTVSRRPAALALGAGLLLAIGVAPARPARPLHRPAPNALAAAAAGRGDSAVAHALDAFIAHEMRQKSLPAFAIALVNDQRVVWTKSYGIARFRDSTPADAGTVYRVGSVSKLFTDIAIMQLVERGVLDLDAPVTRYVPDVHPVNPYHRPITLRELMAHRSGLGRETPVGSYFDDRAPSLAATMRSLDSTTLIYEPGTRTKYSNAGVALVGYVLERTQHQPFAAYVKRAVLDPLGMHHSAFTRDPATASAVADALMWTYDPRSFPAPTFELGIAPAGSMYSTVGDLARFLSALFADGRGVNGRILQPATLHAMWRPEFAQPGAVSGFGLGFSLTMLDGRREIGHGGAIYGFATQLAALPDEKLGVVAITTADGANAVTTRVANTALRLMLAARAGQALPELDTTSDVPPSLAQSLAGRYGRGERAADLVASMGHLYLDRARGGERLELHLLRDTLITDGRLDFGLRVLRAGDEAIIIGSDTLHRVAVPEPPPVPNRWRGLVGEYGWDHETLDILEQDGKLQALIEWFFRYPLDEVSPNVFRMPNWGLYDGERLVFTRDASGRATRVVAAGVSFPRRATGPEDGSQFRITPLRPPAELRAGALAAQPPLERGTFRPADLVELVRLDSTIKLDIRYATSNNFMGTPLYQEARAFMQRPAAEAVVRANRWLRARGYGLLIHDAYRPWFVTKMFWDATPDDKKVFVADPSQGSRHNRGCAVDLTLYDLATGRPEQMTGGYDEMTDRSYPDYPGGTSRQRWLRALLRQAMAMQGFTVYEAEWWHFDYKDWRSYGIGNVGFEALAGGR